jgi:hypothetical protein
MSSNRGALLPCFVFLSCFDRLDLRESTLSPLARPLRIALSAPADPSTRAVLTDVRSRWPERSVEVSSDEAPDLLLVDVSHPDAVNPDLAANLLQMQPGMRLLIVGGPWCESFVRNRRWPTPALWTTQGELSERLLAELSAWSSEKAPLPPTADIAELFLEMGGPVANLTGRTIRLDSPDREWAAAVRDSLTATGATCLEAPPSDADAVGAVLYDLDPIAIRGGDRLKAYTQWPVLLITDSPWNPPLELALRRSRIIPKSLGADAYCRELAAWLAGDC